MKKLVALISFFCLAQISFAQDDSPPPKPLPIINQDTCKLSSASDSCVNDISWVETIPVFPGGDGAFLQYLSKNIKYPQVEKENMIQGKVYVRFFIEKDGSVSNVTVLKSPYNGDNLASEAVRVIRQSPKWSPAMQNGKAVRCAFMIPIIFSLK